MTAAPEDPHAELQWVWTELGDPRAAPLLAGLHAEYEHRYGSNDELDASDAEMFSGPGGAFVLALDGERAVAGGGIRRLDADTAELKRMWTAPSHRRRGLAWVVLGALEDAARERGYRRLVLETGWAQPEAIALYEARGYRRIPGYGRYRDEPGEVSFAVSL